MTIQAIGAWNSARSSLSTRAEEALTAARPRSARGTAPRDPIVESASASHAEQPAVEQDGDAVGDPLDLDEDVRRHQDRHVVRRARGSARAPR